MWEWVGVSGQINTNLLDGVPYAATILAILGAHEFGHYLTRGVWAARPACPISSRCRSGHSGRWARSSAWRHRRQPGGICSPSARPRPLAGLVLAVPLLWLGLSLSHVQPLPPGGYQMEGNSLLYPS